MNAKRIGMAVMGVAAVASLGAATPAKAGGCGQSVTYYTPARTVYVQQPATQTIYVGNAGYVNYPVTTTRSTCLPRHRTRAAVQIGVTKNWNCNRNYRVRYNDCGRSLRKARACHSWNLRNDCGTSRFRRHRW